MTGKIVFALVSSFAFVAAAKADVTNPIGNFHVVSDGVYRGAAPGAEGIDYLSTLNLKTDLDLTSVDSDEKSAALSNSINFISESLPALPGILSIFQPNLNAKEMQTIMSIVGDPSTYPIFVHCEHGEDRTGLVIGLYRVLDEGWTPEAAWAEMLQYGYHTEYKALDRYFEQQTGWTPPKAEKTNSVSQ